MRTTFDQFDQYDQEIDSGSYRDPDRTRNEDRSMDNRGMGRQTYREQSLDEPVQPPEPHDLTLGMTALAGIFLIVVLVCAVFFGFGYSTGRTLHGSKSPASQAAPAAEPAGGPQANAAATDASASTAASTLAAAQPPVKPSAGAPLSDASPEAASRDEAAKAQPQTAEEPGFLPLASRAAAPAARPALAMTAAVDAPSSTLLAAPGGVMVQIAAVMRQADADMLARALRTNGYAAIVRTEPQDKFLHVQVGPFATRDQAKAMRARLQGDGYNAFLKP